MLVKKSIRKTVRSTFLLLALGPLLILASSLTWQNFVVQKQQAIDFQTSLSQRIASEIYQPIYHLQNDFISVPKSYKIEELSSLEPLVLLSRLFAHNRQAHRNIIMTLSLLDKSGMELNKVSVTEIFLPKDMQDLSQNMAFKEVLEHGTVYFSPVWFDQNSGDSRINMSIPWHDLRTHELNAVLVAELRIKELWNSVLESRVGQAGSVYVIDENKRLVAHKNPSLVLRGTYFRSYQQAGFQNNLNGNLASLASAELRLGDQLFYVITELPITEALGMTIQNLVAIALSMLIAILVSLFAGYRLIKRTITPIENLAKTATAIAEGDLSQKARVIQNDEVGTLAGAFNSMTSRLVDTIDHLERNVSRVDRLAHYDGLTGLANRRMLDIELERVLSESKRHGFYAALIFIDLDHFKKINDSFGHSEGDLLLQQVSGRIQREIRLEDTAARLGGDEFVILLPDLAKSVDEATANALRVAEKIRQVLTEPYVINQNTNRITGSFGITLFPIKDRTAEDILKHADTAMYRSKSAGRNNIHFYQPEMQENINRHIKIEKALHDAIVNEEFVLHFQPDISCDGKVIGVESLIRWPGSISQTDFPDNFIAIAEETGLIIPLGDWVMEKACVQFMQWMKQDSDLLQYIGVNVSLKQFYQSDFVDKVIAVLEKTGMPASGLKIELTESILMVDVEDSIIKIDQLKALGVQFSLDDFGTGYSSLSYLSRLPLDIIKIDKSFVQKIHQQHNDAAIISTIIAMARNLNLKVVAEGVEDREQLSFLQAQGCDSYQGYLFSKAIPADELVKYILKARGYNLLAD